MEKDEEFLDIIRNMCLENFKKNRNTTDEFEDTIYGKIYNFTIEIEKRKNLKEKLKHEIEQIN